VLEERQITEREGHDLENDDQRKDVVHNDDHQSRPHKKIEGGSDTMALLSKMLGLQRGKGIERHHHGKSSDENNKESR